MNGGGVRERSYGGKMVLGVEGLKFSFVGGFSSKLFGEKGSSIQENRHEREGAVERS